MVSRLIQVITSRVFSKDEVERTSEETYIILCRATSSVGTDQKSYSIWIMSKLKFIVNPIESDAIDSAISIDSVCTFTIQALLILSLIWLCLGEPGGCTVPFLTRRLCEQNL